jgi:hypothetical protein
MNKLTASETRRTRGGWCLGPHPLADRIAHPHADGRADGLRRSAPDEPHRLRNAPNACSSPFCCAGPSRGAPDGRVERRGGRWCIVEGARLARADESRRQHSRTSSRRSVVVIASRAGASRPMRALVSEQRLVADHAAHPPAGGRGEGMRLARSSGRAAARPRRRTRAHGTGRAAGRAAPMRRRAACTITIWCVLKDALF